LFKYDASPFTFLSKVVPALNSAKASAIVNAEESLLETNLAGDRREEISRQLPALLD
jgi:hypothetical protein